MNENRKRRKLKRQNLKEKLKKPRKRDKRKKKKQSEQSTLTLDFTGEEHSQFSRWYENGYDLPDIRYKKWKKTIPS